MANDSPSEVEDFVAKHIASVEQLEILVRLFEHRDRAWTVAEMNREIRSQDSSIAHWLNVLVASNLAKADETGFRFATGSPELELQVGAVVKFYRERHIRVIELIFSKPKDALMNFARAFDFRKRP